MHHTNPDTAKGVIVAGVSSGSGETYVTVKVGSSSPFGAGLSARGQLFHKSRIRSRGDVDCSYRVEPQSAESFDEGWTTGDVLASYVHLHFASCPELATALVDAARTS